MHWRQFQELQKVSELGDRFISYVDSGSGPPLVFLHGMPTWGFLWQRMLPCLERGRRLLIPDLPGFGFSDKSDRFDRSISRQAERIAGWLQSLGIERADFAGHDIGGGIVLRLAALSPQRVGRICLMNTVCYDSWPSDLMLELAHPAGYRRLNAPAAVRQLVRALREGFARPDEELLAALLAPYETEQGKLSLVRAAASLDPNQTQELAPLLPGLRAPALILWGEDDAFQPLRYGRRLAWDLPRARLVVLPRCGHFLPLERPQEAAAQIESFLKDGPAAAVEELS